MEIGRRREKENPHSSFKTLALWALWLIWMVSKGKSEGNIICFWDQLVFLLPKPNVSSCQPYQHFHPSCFIFLPTYSIGVPPLLGRTGCSGVPCHMVKKTDYPLNTEAINLLVATEYNLISFIHVLIQVLRTTPFRLNAFWQAHFLGFFLCHSFICTCNMPDVTGICADVRRINSSLVRTLLFRIAAMQGN